MNSFLSLMYHRRTQIHSTDNLEKLGKFQNQVISYVNCSCYKCANIVCINHNHIT